MDWPTAFVAIAASGVSAAVAIVAVRTQLANAEKDRQHDIAVRRQERRASAYLDLMKALSRLETGYERMAPIFTQGKPPEPPPPFTDEETWHLNALTDVLASDDLRELIEAWLRKQQTFFFAVEELRRIQEAEKRAWSQGQNFEEETSGRDQWFKVEAIRTELRSELNAIGAQVRAET